MDMGVLACGRPGFLSERDALGKVIEPKGKSNTPRWLK